MPDQTPAVVSSLQHQTNIAQAQAKLQLRARLISQRDSVIRWLENINAALILLDSNPGLEGLVDELIDKKVI